MVSIDYSLALEEYLCKWGFGDGNEIIDACYIYRSTAVKCLNESLEKYKVGHVKAVPDDYDYHNSCHIGFTAERGKEFEYDPATEDYDTILECKKALGDVRFKRFEKAVKHASKMFDEEVKKNEEAQ
jgi:hypothetical protein